ncbi:hypothetical protein D3C72_2297460 [compost metagenome]
MIGHFVQLTDTSGQFQAVHFRHQPVCQEHAGRALFEQADGFCGAVGKAQVLVAGLAQGATDHGAGELGVVHHQDAEMGVGHGRARRGSRVSPIHRRAVFVAMTI